MATIRLIRHATLRLDYGGRRILVDPVLAPKGTLDPAAMSTNQERNPRVDLPLPVEALLDYDECLVTHAHRDHLDAEALLRLPKDKPVICQPDDKAKLEAAGFADVVPVATQVDRDGISFARVGGEHGRGEMIQKMGPSSSFVLTHPAEPVLFVAGDVVWGKTLQAALRARRPGAAIVNAGAATFSQGGPVTMTADDVLQVARELALAQIVVVHLEAWNHCGLTRDELKSRLEDHGLSERVHVPADGESIDVD